MPVTGVLDGAVSHVEWLQRVSQCQSWLSQRMLTHVLSAFCAAVGGVGERPTSARGTGVTVSPAGGAAEADTLGTTGAVCASGDAAGVAAFAGAALRGSHGS